MPINVSENLPAVKTLQNENIFVLTKSRAIHQDIRPLNMLILNLMPTKIETETQILRLLSNTPLQIEVDFLQTNTYKSKNTCDEHLATFYNVFDDIKHKKYDGFILTGAPVEQMDYSDVSYIDELRDILNWCETNVYSSLFICWGAMVGLNHYYNIPKENYSDKLSGVFKQYIKKDFEPIFRCFDDVFLMPHSRFSGVNRKIVKSTEGIDLLAGSDKTGPSIIASTDRRKFFITGHLEYDMETLKGEYFRDLAKNENTKVPENYFLYDNPDNNIAVSWSSHAGLFFSNWINLVYQNTLFNLDDLPKLYGDNK